VGFCGVPFYWGFWSIRSIPWGICGVSAHAFWPVLSCAVPKPTALEGLGSYNRTAPHPMSDLPFVLLVVFVVCAGWALFRWTCRRPSEAKIIEWTRYCPNCGTVGLPRFRSRGAVAFGSSGIYPVLGSPVMGCRACGYTGVMPLDTPVARAVLGDRAEEFLHELVLRHTGRASTVLANRYRGK
jgi:hypothetical protein